MLCLWFLGMPLAVLEVVQAGLALAIIAVAVIIVPLMGKAMVAKLVATTTTHYLLCVLMVNVTCVVTIGNVHDCHICNTSGHA